MRSNEERKAQLRQAKLEREYAELMHCTFKPNVGHGVGSSARDRGRAQASRLPEDYKPIHQRLHKVLQDKQLRLANMRMNQELEDPDLTFAPKINSKSAKLAHMKAVREELSAIDRIASGMATTAMASSGHEKAREERRRAGGKRRYQEALQSNGADGAFAGGGIYDGHAHQQKP